MNRYRNEVLYSEDLSFLIDIVSIFNKSNYHKIDKNTNIWKNQQILKILIGYFYKLLKINWINKVKKAKFC